MAGMFKRNLRELRRQTDKNDIEAFSQLQLFTKQSTYQNQMDIASLSKNVLPWLQRVLKVNRKLNQSYGENGACLVKEI